MGGLMRLDDDDARAVGRWIANARMELHGWRQNDLASDVRISVTTLSSIEQGKQGKRGWNPATMAGIEKSLQVPEGTLRRVASGEDVDPHQVVQKNANGQALDQVSRLAGLVESLTDRVEALERQRSRDG